MVVQHNLPAMNSQRQLGINNSSTAKNLEKLSSGFKVNRAGDDAAGLAISEKMRGQIRGLDMATQNAENGVSLIQTAEGALNETHSILQRIRELAVQSGNGTYHDAVDRENLNKEVQALKGEVDRISSSTHYNGIKLLDGSLAEKVLGYPQVSGTVSSALRIHAWSYGNSPLTAGTTGNYNGTITYSFDGTTAWGKFEADDGYVSIGVWDSQTEHLTFENGSGGMFAPTFNSSRTEVYDARIKIENSGYTCDGTGVVFDDPSFNWFNLDAYISELTPGIGLPLQIGANGTADQRVMVFINGMGAGNLGNSDGKVAGCSVDNIDNANAAISIVDAAINQVSNTRAGLGAMQNRLEHTTNNLGVAKENLQKAESSIRDVDMAKEMMDFTKNNILAQASQSMLAQANALPQGLLQLLAA